MVTLNGSSSFKKLYTIAQLRYMMIAYKKQNNIFNNNVVSDYFFNKVRLCHL